MSAGRSICMRKARRGSSQIPLPDDVAPDQLGLWAPAAWLAGASGALLRPGGPATGRRLIRRNLVTNRYHLNNRTCRKDLCR